MSRSARIAVGLEEVDLVHSWVDLGRADWTSGASSSVESLEELNVAAGGGSVGLILR